MRAARAFGVSFAGTATRIRNETDFRGTTLRETDFDPALRVREVIESLVGTVLETQPDLIGTLLHQLTTSKNHGGYLDERWGDIGEVTQNKIACDVGYRAWVLLETNLGDGDWSSLSFG